MNRKRYSTLILAFVLLLALTGCGQTDPLYPDVSQNSYEGSEIVEVDGIYYFNFGKEHLDCSGGGDTFLLTASGTVVNVIPFPVDDYKGMRVDVFRHAEQKMTTSVNFNAEDTVSIDFADMPNGAYAFIADTENSYALVQVYKTGETVWLCDGRGNDRESAENEIARMHMLDDLLAEHNVTPENSLGNSKKDFAYPTIDTRRPYRRCDTDTWAEFAHEIIPDPSGMTDSEIAMRLAKWLGDNIAFDRYVTEVLDTSRASYYNDFSGKYSTWALRCGKCSDFATIYCLMCREFKIPCDSLATADHVWNVVWLDGRWVEIDTTRLVEYFVDGEDASVRLLREEHVEFTSYCPLRYSSPWTIERLTPHEGIITYNFVVYGYQ